MYAPWVANDMHAVIWLPCLCACILTYTKTCVYIIWNINISFYGHMQHDMDWRSWWCHLHASYIMSFRVRDTSIWVKLSCWKLLRDHTQVLVIITLGSFLYLRICRQESSPYGLSIGNRVQVATGTFVAESFNLSFLCYSCVSLCFLCGFCVVILLLELHMASNYFDSTESSVARHRRTGTAHKGTDRGVCSGSPYGWGLKRIEIHRSCKVGYEMKW